MIRKLLYVPDNTVVVFLVKAALFYVTNVTRTLPLHVSFFCISELAVVMMQDETCQRQQRTEHSSFSTSVTVKIPRMV